MARGLVSRSTRSKRISWTIARLSSLDTRRFNEMRYSIRNSSFHGLHNHGVKHTVHARGKDIPFDNEFTTIDPLPDGIERFQCRHCRVIVLKKPSRLSHLKDCLPYRAHLGLEHGVDDAYNSDEGGWASRPGSAEFRFLPSDGQASSRLECKHCGAHLNTKSNRLLTHLRDCAVYQSGHSLTTNDNAQSTSLDDVLPSAASVRSVTTSIRLDCRPLHPDQQTPFHLDASMRPSDQSTDQRCDHWGLFDLSRPAKRLRSGHPAAAASSQLIGRFSLEPMHMNVGGVCVPVGLLRSLTSDWLHPGATTSCLVHFVRVCQKQNHALAVIPAEIVRDANTAAAARAMGFTAMPSWFKHTFAKTALLSQDAPYPRHLLSVLDASEDSQDVLECLGRIGNTRHGRLFQSSDVVVPQLWASSSHRLVGCRDLRGTLRGFFISKLNSELRQLVIEDLVYEDVRILAGLLGFLSTQDHADTIELSTPDPHFLRLLRHPPTATDIVHSSVFARIVHVNPFVATHMRARNFNFASGIVLQLVVPDAALPSTSSLHPHNHPPSNTTTTLLVCFDGGHARVETSTTLREALEVRLQLNLEALTALMLGCVPLIKLLQWGQAQLTPSDPRTSRLLTRAFEVDDVPASRAPF
ncbi:hypothetical protein, variant [Aphanomyces invadans]|uniref:Uncharacterized protein n=1 Tax=Aphanomyces invadans TaxID=157072 RepID=A0A024UTP1_9STRA|nr:hypothetical protein, variant [Aphanomyces invadans]ETW09876.1 hypothetical protein, variant [Aphanomyces invadans]|eukprot:XP_008861287.1 hypothetical protein, variant [Aphanomyces invadans]